uniref:Uncharacterized protein n=1 Tax=Rhizophora mucronata TaxID=61149 RepID=A0A2P2PUQ2_RHIMU
MDKKSNPTSHRNVIWLCTHPSLPPLLPRFLFSSFYNIILFR